MPAHNKRFGAMATRLRRNFKEIKDITLDSVATIETPPLRQAAGRYTPASERWYK
jgi:hypothetical protein